MRVRLGRLFRVRFAAPWPSPKRIVSSFANWDANCSSTRRWVYVTGNQFPVILVSGESGVGKTSLLRAGLMVPLTEQFDRKVIYWEATPTNSWESLTRTIIEGFGGRARGACHLKVF